MSGSEIRVVPQLASGNRAYWLPFAGTGNGLSASAWAPIADLPEGLAMEALRACADVQVAAFTAPSGGQRPSREPRRFRVWVDSVRYPSAEETIRNMLARAQDARRSSRGGRRGLPSGQGDGAHPHRARAR